MSGDKDFGDAGAARVVHLQMVQSVIGRMSGHAFALKALAVALVGAILAMLGGLKEATPWHVWLGIVPVLALWWLDTRFFDLERRYRAKFDAIREGSEVAPFDMTVDKGAEQDRNMLRFELSWSVRGRSIERKKSYAKRLQSAVTSSIW